MSLALMRPRSAIFEGDRAAVLVGELLGHGVAQPHVQGALDLALVQGGIHDLPGIVGGGDPGDLPGLVQFHQLGGEAEGVVGDHVVAGLGRLAGRHRPVADPAAPVFLPHQVLQGLARGQVLLELLAGGDDGVGEERGPAGAGGHAGLRLLVGLHEHLDEFRVDAGLLHQRLHAHGVVALAHLAPAVVELHPVRGLDDDLGVAEVGQAAADASVLHARGDPSALGRVEAVLEGLQALADAHAGGEDLPRGDGTAFCEGVVPAELPAVEAAQRQSSSRQDSKAKLDWLTPKPRKAPQGALLVTTAVPVTCTLGTE